MTENIDNEVVSEHLIKVITLQTQINKSISDFELENKGEIFVELKNNRIIELSFHKDLG
jgi:hypothetical protein